MYDAVVRQLKAAGTPTPDEMMIPAKPAGLPMPSSSLASSMKGTSSKTASTSTQAAVQGVGHMGSAFDGSLKGSSEVWNDRSSYQQGYGSL